MNERAYDRAITTKKFFSRQTSITITIAAPAERIWSLLTDADRFAKWNTTVLELSGHIALGEKILLRSTLAPKRIFKLKVKQFEVPTRLSSGDAMGTRIYSLTPNPQGEIQFTMSEKIGGPLFPLFARMIPPFDESFNQFARDLKCAAEAST
nr:SRPBCC domain-containing protein [uncultured Undibacterium sp.]